MSLSPKGGTEILHEQLLERLKPEELEGINIIRSICHPSLVQKDKKNVLWQHLSYDQPNAQLMHDRRFVDSVDYFVYVSHWSFNRYREKFNIPEYKSFVLKNATPSFTESSKQPNKDKIKIIYTSTPWRGLSVLLLAVEYLNKIRDDFEVDVYSSTKIYGSKFEEAEGSTYEPLYERCKNTKNINYIGYASNDEIRTAVSNADIYAYPSIFEETSCLSIIEAMSAGCHVVTTNYGALPETCGEFATMIEFEPNLKSLAERFAATLHSVIDDFKAGKYEKSLELQKAYYQQHYSWETRIQEWRNFLSYVRQKT